MWLVRLSAVVFVLVPALLSYWWFEAPSDFYIERTIETPRVPPGGTLVVHIRTRASAGQCEATVRRTIVDATQVETVYAEEVRSREADYRVELTVPLGAAPGPAIYNATIFRRCNPLQRLFPRPIEQPPLTFTIEPLPMQGQVPAQQGIYQMPSLTVQ